MGRWWRGWSCLLLKAGKLITLSREYEGGDQRVAFGAVQVLIGTSNWRTLIGLHKHTPHNFNWLRGWPAPPLQMRAADMASVPRTEAQMPLGSCAFAPIDDIPFSQFQSCTTIAPFPNTLPCLSAAVRCFDPEVHRDGDTQVQVRNGSSPRSLSFTSGVPAVTLSVAGHPARKILGRYMEG